MGPRPPLLPRGLGTFLCCGCGTAAAAGGGSQRTGRQDRDWGPGIAGLGAAKAVGAEGRRRGSWLSVSPTQNEAAAPGGRALRRNPGRGASSAGPAQGERWARQRRTPSRALHPVTRRCTRPPSGMPRNRTPGTGLLTFLGLPKPSATRAAFPKPHPNLFKPKLYSPDTRRTPNPMSPRAEPPRPTSVPDPPPHSGHSPSPPVLRESRLRPRFLQGSQAPAGGGLSAGRMGATPSSPGDHSAGRWMGSKKRS